MNILSSQPNCGAVLGKAVERFRIFHETDSELQRLIADNVDCVADTVGIVRAMADTSTNILLPAIESLDAKYIPKSSSSFESFKAKIFQMRSLGSAEESNADAGRSS